MKKQMDTIRRPEAGDCIAKVPYLNSVPFFRGLQLDGWQFTEGVPRAVGTLAADGQIAAGPLPLADYLRLQDRFERLGHFGIAVRGRARSALLFARKSLRQLGGTVMAVTEESSTTARLLRLLLEQRYHVTPAAYTEHRSDADALLLIGDEALRFQRTNTEYPYETDIAFEWWLWQHLPCVFAVWAVRKDVSPQQKKALELSLARSLAINLGQLDAIAKDVAPQFEMSAEEMTTYLSGFTNRLGSPEEAAIQRCEALLKEHDLLFTASK